MTTIMNELNQHIIENNESVRTALIRLDRLASDAVLFVTENKKLIGAITDGDLRRGFIKGLGFEDPLRAYMNPHPRYVNDGEVSIDQLEKLKKIFISIIPVINSDKTIVDIINLRKYSTVLPVHVVIMAGGKGKRLLPLTEKTPKPLLKIGDKPIIEYNIDRLINVGVKNFTISINYLGEQIVNYFNDGSNKNIKIDYIREIKPLGTIGSVLLKKDFTHNEILVMNSDLLTNIDFTDFYKVFRNSDADMAVAAVSYKVNIPYGVLETNDNNDVLSIKEKPNYTYFSNAGIYLIKKELLTLIPEDSVFDITELMEKVIEMNRKLITYPINGYWLDIGKHEDYKKAQEDIKHIKL